MSKTSDKKIRSEALYVTFGQLVCDHTSNNRPLDSSRARDYAVNILLDRQISPMSVDRIRKGGMKALLGKTRYSVRIGFHRWEAFRILNDEGILLSDLTEFPLDNLTSRRGVVKENDRLFFRGDIKVDVSRLTAAETRRQRLSENLLRNDLDPISQGKAYQDMVTKDGYTITALATLYGVASSTITERIALLNLPQEVQDLVQAGKKSLCQILKVWNLETGKKIVHRKASGFRVRGKREFNQVLKALAGEGTHDLLDGLDAEQRKLVERTLRWARGEELARA